MFRRCFFKKAISLLESGNDNISLIASSVGFEDSIYIEKGVLAKSNGEMVAKVVRIAKELGREIATSAEAREILGLKPRK